MKLTKSKLKQIIKEELGGLQEQSAGSVWVAVEASDTYGGQDTEVKILGIFNSPDFALLRGYQVMKVPLNKLNDYGYHPTDEGEYQDDEDDFSPDPDHPKSFDQ